MWYTYSMPSTRSNGSHSRGKRLHTLDSIRGITLISMILYHAAWDAVYLIGAAWPWYHSYGAYLWQQSICWTFILLSGFCIPISAHRWKRGLVVFGAGLLVTAATLLVMPQEPIIFGVLTFLGSAMLVMAAFEKAIFSQIPPVSGLILNVLLFVVLRPVNSGFLGVMDRGLVRLPAVWYHGYAATYLGFPDPGFYSSDYFSFLPWIFLFLCGYYLGRLLGVKNRSHGKLWYGKVPGAVFLGRHSLLIYLLHQPVLYMFVLLISALRK